MRIYAHLTEKKISIHAPRTGSDADFRRDLFGNQQFQSTLPARGATMMQLIKEPEECIFQSTLPARGATVFFAKKNRAPFDFNPRSPHGERRRRRTQSGG